MYTHTNTMFTWSGKVVHGLRSLDIFPEDPDLIPSTHLANYNYLKLQFHGIYFLSYN